MKTLIEQVNRMEEKLDQILERLDDLELPEPELDNDNYNEDYDDNEQDADDDDLDDDLDIDDDEPEQPVIKFKPVEQQKTRIPPRTAEVITSGMPNLNDLNDL